jgi:hypothetical protein
MLMPSIISIIRTILAIEMLNGFQQDLSAQYAHILDHQYPKDNACH